jgi:16S rRNA (cytosine967-C5)-methyltransferase
VKRKQLRGARDWALQLLLEWQEKNTYSNLALHRILLGSDLDPRDRSLVTELFYGVITRKNTLEYLVSKLVKKPNQLAPWVHVLLQLGLYQLLYLDRIPARAAVHESVQLAKKRGHKGIAGLVNGVLRSYLRQKDQLLPKNPRTLQEKAIYYSYPEWIIKRLIEVYGEQTAHLVLEAQNNAPNVSLRINSLRWDRPEWMEEWQENVNEKVVPSKLSPYGVIVQGVGNPANLPFYRDGSFTIQDESSMLVGQALDPKPGMRVLDMCGAPGGKTTHLAELMENQGEIIANDLHLHKEKLIQEQAKRLGIEIIHTRVGDARELKDQLPQESFDAILLDAPCSGLGVIRRKPDIKWRKECRDIEELCKLQRELLETAAKLLKPRGTLVYSTCTWEPKENVEQITDWLAAHPEFQPDAQLLDFYPSIVREYAITGEGWIQILPHHFDTDGFFISRFIKST